MNREISLAEPGNNHGYFETAREQVLLTLSGTSASGQKPT